MELIMTFLPIGSAQRRLTIVDGNPADLLKIFLKSFLSKD